MSSGTVCPYALYAPIVLSPAAAASAIIVHSSQNSFDWIAAPKLLPLAAGARPPALGAATAAGFVLIIAEPTSARTA